MKQRQCKDCRAAGTSTKRDAKWPGPRCYTHHLAAKRATKARAHARRLATHFEITPEDYQAIYVAQDGRCYICRWARGISKNLCVDHDHKFPGCEHPPEKGCRRCIRALLCSSCNQTIGRLNTEALQRAIEVLTDPPARRVLASSIT